MNAELVEVTPKEHKVEDSQVTGVAHSTALEVSWTRQWFEA